MNTRVFTKKMPFVVLAIMVTMFLIALCTQNSQAQVTIGSKIAPSKYSLLDLKETAQGTASKGFHMPRLTRTQRDALLLTPADSLAAKGLIIYNTESDCNEYWNGEEWISLCQGSLNPQVNLPQPACAKIKVYGAYFQNAPLNTTHYIVIPFVVTKKGNYSIIVTSTNGYYFQANGIFNSTGTFDVKLDGVGVPAQSGTDEFVITCNGVDIGTTCNLQIMVGALAMGYTADCSGIQVEGTYQTRQFMDNSNYVTVPVDVINTGTTAFETAMVNGIKFTANQQLTSLGAGTLTLQAQGSPKQSGKYTYTFTTDGSVKNTCSFDVSFISALGTFADPACKCLDIYEERPDVSDGEYWLIDCVVDGTPQPVKTFCDIKNGGWTLVWSYSEKTARGSYTPANTMTINPSTYSVFKDVPLNRVTTETGTINYANYRLNRSEWQHFPNSTGRSQIKMHITDNPINMNDEWALNNYGIISPRTAYENPVETNFADYRLNAPPAAGKVFGKRWQVFTSGGGGWGGWDEVSGNRGELVLYSSNNYTTHYNFGNQGSGTQFQVVPNRGGANNTVAFSNMNNLFGWFGETEVNHHFGKCGSSGDNYSFSTKTCSPGDLYPHSINGGEGRYLQWYVK